MKEQDPQDKQTRLATWFRLSRVPKLNVGNVFESASRLDCSPEKLLSQSTETLRAMGWTSVQINSLRQQHDKSIHDILAWLSLSALHSVLTPECEHYPQLLTQLYDPPFLLYCIGDTALLSRRQLAMVGTRHPTQAGKANAIEFSKQVVNNGFAVTSGLALGIDTCAHYGALEAGGATIAVLGTGVDNCYPQRNRQLYERIIQSNGVVISEAELGAPAHPSRFPKRNRIVSGLSEGVIVVEAALKSGSLITARLSSEQAREVFAIPGSIHNRQSAGCHWLIKQGAKLCDSIDDVFEELSSFFPGRSNQQLNRNAIQNKPMQSAPLEDVNLPGGEIRKSIPISPNLPSGGARMKQEKKPEKSHVQRLATDRLLDSVDFDATPVDVIAERSDLPVSEVLAGLLKFELRGLVTAVPGGYAKLGGK